MKVKRIFAPDMRQAMRRVREEIGPDAVIISNHRVAGGVEVVAAREDEYEAAQAELKRSRAARAPTERREEQIRILTGAHSHQSEQASRNAALEEELNKTRARIAEASQRMAEPEVRADRNVNRQINDEDDEDLRSILESLKARNRRRDARAPETSSVPEIDPPRAPRSPPRREPAFQPEPLPIEEDPALRSMQQEIQELRQMLQQSSVREPVVARPAAPVEPAARHVQVARHLQQLGLGSSLVRQLMSGVEPELASDKAWRNALARLADALPVLGEELVERGGMIVFVGPTGVGKTTTIGKLAARHVLQHGSSSVALVTTDCFRIAAHEQLKTFGRILDVPVRVVDETHSLEEVLQSLRNKRLVLIDTAGMNASDPQGQLQMQMLSGVTLRLKKLLVLSCSSQLQLMRNAYDNYSELGLQGCVLSKTDESGSLGEALTLVVEKQLPIAYVTDGQKIPDDIGIAQRNDLVSRTVVIAQRSAQQSDDGFDDSTFRTG
ncbi:MAG: flagellar biosynthesis protein FlhF [Oceanospirillales bacterium]|uniref:Flagellar biosynthesis protein FlhF n=1 Tax=Marinobacterium halophilum TaxID=267374 RepID=A0A2P8ESB2_9GAMM|nr:flagellar biosynthesis protein FlhF [Marinobacterium halophilum]MBR9828776.1 flagellar biosynthesis protein FlhF [Oceanospirillales bacterium]PSL12377.1 flagellar biosynthesis protein FlhF [Marinobacterium halophilum]